MTTPYPTESTPAHGTADAGRDTSSTTAPDGTEPVPESTAPGAAEAHVDHGTPAAAGTRAPEIAETTELDGVAITERLETEGTSGTGGGESSAEGQSPAAPSGVYLPGPGPSVASPAPAAAAAAAAAESSAPERRGARMGTVVWGILLAAIGAGIVARGLDVGFDVELALIVVLCVMGGALLVGSIVAVIRKT